MKSQDKKVDAWAWAYSIKFFVPTMPAVYLF